MAGEGSVWLSMWFIQNITWGIPLLTSVELGIYTGTEDLWCDWTYCPLLTQRRGILLPLEHGMGVHSLIALLPHCSCFIYRVDSFWEDTENRWPSFLGHLKAFSKWDGSRTHQLHWCWSRSAAATLPAPDRSPPMLQAGSRVAWPEHFQDRVHTLRKLLGFHSVSGSVMWWKAYHCTWEHYMFGGTSRNWNFPCLLVGFWKSRNSYEAD